MKIRLTDVELDEVLQALNMFSVNRKLVTGYTGTQFAETVIESIQEQRGEIMRKEITSAEKEEGVYGEICPKCEGTVGHKINCPDGIAFSRNGENQIIQE